MAFVAGHFGEWLQGRIGPTGEVALVTMACPNRGVRVDFNATASPDLIVEVSGEVLTSDQCRRFLGALGLPVHGRIRIMADLPPGGGCGMSTAALVALARAAGAQEARIAAACLAVEGASDPLMLPRPDAVLWASRSASPLADLPPVPLADVVGGFWGPMQRTDHTDARFPPIDDLIAEWRQGPDLAGAVRLAVRSAQRTTALRGPVGDPTEALAKVIGALGHARAHTGPARALIFAPGTVPTGARAAFEAAGYSGCLQFTTGSRA